jgi:hypothetical protein
MTRAKDQTTAAKDERAEAQQRSPERDEHLDAEIVRDLEVDEGADDVRGGPCGNSKLGAGV